MHDDYDPGASFGSHVELADLGASQSLDESLKPNVVADIRTRHRLLAEWFQKWRVNVQHLRKQNVQELHAVQKVMRIEIRSIFQKWRSRYVNYKRLGATGQKLRAYKLFSLWKNIVDSGFEERKRFMRLLLARRGLYQRRFLRVWRGVRALKTKYKAVAMTADAFVGDKIVRALRIVVRNKRRENARVEETDVADKFYRKRWAMERWKMRLRSKLIERVARRRLDEKKKTNAFTTWQQRKRWADGRKNRVNTAEHASGKALQRRAFWKWFEKFHDLSSMRERAESAHMFLRNKCMGRALMLWISRFNQSGYLSSCERELLRNFRLVRLRRSFGKWHSACDNLTQKYAMASGCATEYNTRKMTKYFNDWRSRFSAALFDKAMSKRGSREMRKFRLRRGFGIWEHRFQVHRDDRVQNANAAKFRKFSLLGRAFFGIRSFAQTNKRQRGAAELAEEHHDLHLERSAMRAWKALRNRTRRRFIMIAAVLKSWAHNVQLKQLRKWHAYCGLKKRQTVEIQDAYNVYERRSMRLALMGFVVGGQRIPFVHISDDSEDPDEIASIDDDPLASIIDDDILSGIPIAPLSAIHIERPRQDESLPLPKRPSFLGAGSKNPVTVAPPPLRIDARADDTTMSDVPDRVERVANPISTVRVDRESEYETLALRFSELKAKLDSCDQSEKEQTVHEIHDLIQQIGHLRDKCATSS